MLEPLLACACGGPHPSLLLALTLASLAVVNAWPLTAVEAVARKLSIAQAEVTRGD